MRLIAPRAVLAATRNAREERERRDVGRLSITSSRSSRFSRQSRGALRRAACRSLSADRSPTSLGVHEGSFEPLVFFIELQTIFLDSAIEFPL